MEVLTANTFPDTKRGLDILPPTDLSHLSQKIQIHLSLPHSDFPCPTDARMQDLYNWMDVTDRDRLELRSRMQTMGTRSDAQLVWQLSH